MGRLRIYLSFLNLIAFGEMQTLFKLSFFAEVKALYWPMVTHDARVDDALCSFVVFCK